VVSQAVYWMCVFIGYSRAIPAFKGRNPGISVSCPETPIFADDVLLQTEAGFALEARELVFPDDALVPVALTFYAILKLVVGFGQQSHYLEARSSEHLLMAIGGKADTLPHGKFM
jgi:hypothetical protein